MKLLAFALGVVLVVVMILAALDRQEHSAALDGWRREKSILQAKLAEASTQVRVDSVEVVRRETVVRTRRDTILAHLTDTLLVREYVYQTDTLRVACLACTESASRLRAYSDSLNRVNDSLIRALTPSRFQKYRGPALFVGGVVLGAWVRGQ